MTPEIQDIYKEIYYSNHKDVELHKLIIGILGSRMNTEDWHNVSETVNSLSLIHISEPRDVEESRMPSSA